VVLTRVYFENSGKDDWHQGPVALEADGVRVCGELASEECSDRPTTLDSRGPSPRPSPVGEGDTNGFGGWFYIGAWNRPLAFDPLAFVFKVQAGEHQAP
jgi:hypothetical protein